VLSIPAFVGVVGGVVLLANRSDVLGGTVLGLTVIYIIGLALVHSALTSIFQAAVYMYTQGVVDQTRGFPVKLLRDSMVAK
jgi:hypothetical protein